MASSDLGQMVVKIVGDNSGLDKSIDSSKQKMEAFKTSAMNLGGALSLGVTAPLVAMFTASVKSAASMEMLQASFETMLGSASKATKLMDDLKKMAAVTPFETGDLAQASKTLLQFGVSADKLIPTLKMLGDASGGSSAKFSSMALVFGQISSAGKLMGQDLLQLINAGFNPLKEISDRTGESMASLKDKMSKGAISADMVAESFKAATSEGGRFFGGMETASKTLDGLISTLKDDVATLGRSFIEDLMPFIKQTVKDMSALAQRFSALSPETKKAILEFAAFAAAIGPLIILSKKANDGLKDMKNIFVGLATKNGLIGLAVAGVIALGIGFVKLIESANNTKKALLEIERLSKGGKAENPQESLKLVNKELEKQEDALKRIRSAPIQSSQQLEGQKKLLADQQAVVDKLKATQKLILDNIKYGEMDARGQGMTAYQIEQQAKNKEAIALTTDEINEKEKKRLAIEEQIRDIINGEKSEYVLLEEQITALANTTTKTEEEKAAAIKILRDKQTEIVKEAYDKEQEYAEDNAQKVADLDKWLADLQEKGRQDKLDKEKKLQEDILSLTVQTYSAIANIVSIFQSNAIEAQKEALAEELRLNDEALQAALVAAGVQDQTAVESAQTKLDAAIAANDMEAISEAQKALTKARIEEEYAAKKLAIEKQGRQDAYELELKAFKTNQAFAIGQIAIETAMAVAKVWRQTGIGGLIAQAGPIAMGILQASAVLAQKPPAVPAFAEGGIVMPRAGGVQGILAEAGQPEVIFPLDQLNRFLGSKNTNSINASSSNENMRIIVNLDSRPILDKIFDATLNRTVLISQGAVVS